MTKTLARLLLPLAAWCVLAAEAGGPQYSMLPAGDVKPCGWIWKQMDLDLREGLAGHYPKVSSIVDVELFARKDATLAKGYEYPRGKVARSWWVGEVEGNWLDSVVRLAFLTGNEECKARVRRAYEHIAEAQSQEPDGYIGIYAPLDRFALRAEKNNSGELWTQSRLFQGMLAYYEYTKDAKILEAVKKAVDCTLKNYVGKEVFFQGSGVSHGVAFTDTLEWLFRLSGDPKYVEAMRWLYEDFSCREDERPPKAGKDLSYDELKYADRLWWSHAPHTMEGLHTPVITYAMTGEVKYKAAAENVLLKYDRHDTPGGGVVGDEGIDRRLGTSMLPREYCTMVSAVMALNRIAAWTGDLGASGRAEAIALNAAQGARFHPALKAVRYLSHDNQKDASTPAHAQRYLYSAWHGAAPCCSTTAARLMPYYVEGLWLADHKRNALIANGYGPNRVSTTVAGRSVRLTEETAYPFADTVRFVFDAEAETTLVLRKPPRSGDVRVTAPGAKVEGAADRISITGAWKAGDTVSVTFDFQPQLVAEPHLTNAYHYCWGPLLFSLPLEESRKAIMEYETLDGKPSGFFMWEITPKLPERWSFRFDPKEAFAKVDLPGGSADTPWASSPVGLRGRMRNAQGEAVEVTLTPLGASLLRRTSFPDCTQPIVGPQEEWVVKEKVVNPDGTIQQTGAREKDALRGKSN